MRIGSGNVLVRDSARSLADVIGHVAFELNLDPGVIAGRARPRCKAPLGVGWARLAVAWLARRHTQATLRATGGALGNRGVRRISAMVVDAHALRETDYEFRWLTDDLDIMLGAA